MLSKEIIEEIQQLQYYIYYDGISKPLGWKSIAVMDIKETGFYGETFEKNGYVVIVFRGSQIPGDIKDARNSLAYLVKKAPSQLINAEIFYNKILSQYGKNAEVIVSGYSLGGLLAQIVGYKYKNLTYTFGAIGAGDYFGKVPENVDYIHNYGRATDIFFLSRFDKHVGKLYIIDSDKPKAFELSKIEDHFPVHAKSSVGTKEYKGTRNLPTNTDKKVFESGVKFFGTVQTSARGSKNTALSVQNGITNTAKMAKEIAKIPDAAAN